MKDTTLTVNGMTCGHCVKAVTEALYTLDGVDLVEIQLDSGEVKVSYDNTKTTVSDMKTVIEDQGYDIA